FGRIAGVLVGVGESGFPRLLEYYFAPPPPQSGKNSVDGLDSVVLRIDGTIKHIPKKSYIENLDTLPMPGYEYLELEKYPSYDTSKWFNPRNIKISSRQFPLLTSRSCPNQCNFCAMRFVMGNRIRFRSARHVVDEIKYVYDKYGINYFKICDDNFTFDRQRTLEICRLIIRNKLKIYFEFPNSLMVKTLDEEVIDNMAEAGALRFWLAIESGSEFIRNKIMRKNVSEEKILEVASLLKKRNVWVSAGFMLGMPEETEESCLDTMRMIEKLDIDYFMLPSHVNPFPGTKLFDQCVRDRLFTSAMSIGDLWKGDFSYTSAGPDDFLIKPYNMEITKLKEYDQKIKALMLQKNSAWEKHRAEATIRL
ncbi:MAG: B12-binding domain-containing radical SAM protein, partial [Spirochaetaceae bacterium]|nr:B12-binding domain-containing radical SAM protein [Spirochaetaceae bacterium]